jgi:transcriptional regulator with XRE-family HTH domain
MTVQLSSSQAVEKTFKHYPLRSINQKLFESMSLFQANQLVPFSYSEKLERRAEKFLKKYFPLSLEKPTAVFPYQLVENMGLVIQKSEITQDCSIFGQIYFHEDALKGIQGGTILVDSRVVDHYNIGALNNTIVHECVHWEMHQEALRLWQDSTGRTILPNSDMTSFLEWHAQVLTPRIMMPLRMFKKRVELVREEFSWENDPIARIDKVIETLAEFFGVSRLAAKIRMIEVGYPEAIGAFNYIEHHYIPTHWWKKGLLSSHQTFCISSKDAMIQSVEDENLKKMLRSGKYLFLESHFVLNLPEFIETDALGNLTLSDYARHHMDECCLVFDLSLKIRSGSSLDIPRCVLNRGTESPYELRIKFHKGFEYSTNEKQAAQLKKVIKENAKIYATLTNDLCDCLEKVLKWREMTRVQLAEMIPMSEKQVRRIFSGESSGSLETLVAICLAMYLPPEISFHIIEKSSHTFKMNDTRHQCYHFVLQTQSGKSLSEVREFLRNFGVTL